MGGRVPPARRRVFPHFDDPGLIPTWRSGLASSSQRGLEKGDSRERQSMVDWRGEWNPGGKVVLLPLVGGPRLREAIHCTTRP